MHKEDLPEISVPRCAGREHPLEMFRKMALIRRFKDYPYQLFLQGKVPGIHTDNWRMLSGNYKLAVEFDSRLMID